MFFLFFFSEFLRFWAFLGKGSSKTPQKYFCQKPMSKTFSEKNDKNFDASFSSAFFFYRVFGSRLCFSAMGVQNVVKNKNHVERF
jgi:hypothetical protein